MACIPVSSSFWGQDGLGCSPQLRAPRSSSSTWAWILAVNVLSPQQALDPSGTPAEAWICLSICQSVGLSCVFPPWQFTEEAWLFSPSSRSGLCGLSLRGIISGVLLLALVFINCSEVQKPMNEVWFFFLPFGQEFFTALYTSVRRH